MTKLRLARSTISSALSCSFVGGKNLNARILAGLRNADFVGRRVDRGRIESVCNCGKTAFKFNERG